MHSKKIIPVFKRIRENPAFSRVLASPTEGASPLLPAGKLSSPVQMYIYSI